MKIKEIREIAEQYKNEYEAVAVRTQEEEFKLGTIGHLSKIWDNGEETEIELNGISATDIESEAVKMHSEEHDLRSGYYYGDHLAIIVGNNYTMGEDDGEVIITDAEVIEILK